MSTPCRSASYSSCRLQLFATSTPAMGVSYRSGEDLVEKDHPMFKPAPSLVLFT